MASVIYERKALARDKEKKSFIALDFKTFFFVTTAAAK
jgi:hypothetical protein